MLAVNREIDLDAVLESEAVLGAGCYGKVLAWGPSVFKVGSVSAHEADNLNEARSRIGGEVFPAAELLRAGSWADERGVLMMERIPGKQLCELDDWREQDMWLFEVRDILAAYGIGHCDLHSGNVMVTDDGMIRVVDGMSLEFWNPNEPRW